MKYKFSYIVLITIPLIILITVFAVYCNTINNLVQAINSLSQNAEQQDLLNVYQSSLTYDIMLLCACCIGIICAASLLIIMLRKNLQVNGSIKEQWRAYKQARAEKKAAKSAEQKQARIAELERKLNELKKDE